MQIVPQSIQDSVDLCNDVVGFLEAVDSEDPKKHDYNVARARINEAITLMTSPFVPPEP